MERITNRAKGNGGLPPSTVSQPPSGGRNPRPGGKSGHQGQAAAPPGERQ